MGHGQMRRTDGVGNGHYWVLRYSRWKGNWRLQSRGPGTVCDCQQTREAALDKGRSCKQLSAKRDTRKYGHFTSERGVKCGSAWPNSNLSLSQLAALAESKFLVHTAFRSLV
jgi:hypothetical protein